MGKGSEGAIACRKTDRLSSRLRIQISHPLTPVCCIHSLSLQHNSQHLLFSKHISWFGLRTGSSLKGPRMPSSENDPSSIYGCIRRLLREQHLTGRNVAHMVRGRCTKHLYLKGQDIFQCCHHQRQILDKVFSLTWQGPGGHLFLTMLGSHICRRACLN